jgi:methionyl-tRNA synthetase
MNQSADSINAKTVPQGKGGGGFRYFTTPIYYASGKPHAGHLYTTILTQIMKGHHLSAGNKVLTLTGMDEHGEKIAEKARDQGVTPQAFVDALEPQWSKAWKDFGLDFDIFMRTTSPDHIKNVQEILSRCKANGDIYFGEHEGFYCVDCEEFLTPKQMDEDKKCLIHKRKTEIRKEGNYYFRTTKYTENIRELIHSGKLLRSKRYAAELLGMLESLDADLSISRPKTRTNWGIELPFDASHVTYVWFDALPNYLTGIGGVSAAPTSTYWRNAVHFLGKDILRFHGIYWPAMLLSLGLPVPELFVHGWLLQSGEKMSKSLGNVITLESIRDHLGKDAFVNTVFRLVNPGDDIEISESLICERYNADLANGIGNLLSRTVTLAQKAFAGRYPPCSAQDLTEPELQIQQDALATVESVLSAMEDFRLADALRQIWTLIGAADRYLTLTKPWELMKFAGQTTSPEYKQLVRILGTACGVLRLAGLLAYPFFPEKMVALLTCLGESVAERNDFYQRARTFILQDTDRAERRLGEVPRLFPRIELPEAEPQPQVSAKKSGKVESAATQTNQSGPKSGTASATATGSNGSPALAANIPFDQFQKVDIRVGLVEKAEIVEGSDKLLRVEVVLGPHGVRQIFSGIRQWVKPEELAGRKVLIAANLDPRKMRFGVSEGMLLSTEGSDGKVSPVIVPDHLEPGSRLA